MLDWLNENQYFIKTKYVVPKNWFNSPKEVLETTLYGLKIDKSIISSDIKSIEYDTVNFIAHVNFLTNMDKSTFLKKLKGTSTSSEHWELI